MITVFSHQDQIRAMTSHKPFLRPAGLWALGRGMRAALAGGDCAAGSSFCLGSLRFAAKWGTWAQLTSFVCLKPETAVCGSGSG